MLLYRHELWLKFREEVIQLDNGQCARCSRSLNEGAILQVHHKEYISGRKPWEYPFELCEALCKGCHAEEHGKVMPRSGWEEMGSDDLGEPSGECDLCGTSIRHVFLVQHSTWGVMAVGEVCCDHLTNTHNASVYMQRVRQKVERRKRFSSSSRWSVDQHGIHSISHKGIRVAILNENASFRLRINSKNGKLRFGSVLEAKMKCFDLIDSGAIAKWLATGN